MSVRPAGRCVDPDILSSGSACANLTATTLEAEGAAAVCDDASHYCYASRRGRRCLPARAVEQTEIGGSCEPSLEPFDQRLALTRTRTTCAIRGGECVTPELAGGSIMTLLKASGKAILFVGAPGHLAQIPTSDFVARIGGTVWLVRSAPAILDTWLSTLASVSFGLALLNAAPVHGLDGERALRTAFPRNLAARVFLWAGDTVLALAALRSCWNLIVSR